MNQIKNFTLLFAICILPLSACGIFGSSNNNSATNNIQRPPQKVSAADAAAPNMNQIQPVQNSAKGKVQASNVQKTSRIQEQRDSGGSVTQVKVTNSHDIPDYYIYPNKQPIDSNAPSSVVMPPSWQINW